METVLDLKDLDREPIIQFDKWFSEARESLSADWYEPNAMTLATCGSDGRVSARIVLLKRFSSAGFVFFTNYKSTKADQLGQNCMASLVFYWPVLHRQVRVEGTISKTDSQTSDDYFHERPRGSQIGAIASAQSQPLADRQQLERETQTLSERYQNQEIPRPEYWGGYVLAPNRIEFWQGRMNRLHDRFVYSRDSENDEWEITRLAP